VTEEGPPDEATQPPTDMSVPIWVWVILGFALVMAVVIVMIIWAGGGGTEHLDAAEEEVIIEEVAPAEDAPATGPATAPVYYSPPGPPGPP
jgi:hypothetical protein